MRMSAFTNDMKRRKKPAAHQVRGETAGFIDFCLLFSVRSTQENRLSGQLQENRFLRVEKRPVFFSCLGSGDFFASDEAGAAADPAFFFGKGIK